MEPDRTDDSNLTGLSGAKRVYEKIASVDNSEDSDMIRKTRVSEKVDDQENNSEEERVLRPSIDLNGPIKDIINVSSDDDDEDAKREGLDTKGNEGVAYSSPTNSQRRYTTKEKGKEKIDEFLSHISSMMELDEDDQIEMCISEERQLIKAAEILQSIISMPKTPENLEDKPLNQDGSVVIPMDQDGTVEMPEIQTRLVEIPENQEELPQIQANLGAARRYFRESDLISERERRIERAQAFAHFDPDRDIWDTYYTNKYKNVKGSSNEAKMTLGGISGPFSSALKAIEDRNAKQGARNMYLEWNSKSSDCKSSRVARSLLDLSLDVLIMNADAIGSIDYVPGQLKQRIANLLCDARKMDMCALQLFVKDSPTEIRVKDCSWMTEAQLISTFQNLDTQNLRVLQLDFCGQFSFDDIINNSLAQSPNSLPCLGILSLRGAGRLSDNTLKPLIVSAPLLQSVNLGQCALLTASGIKVLADSLKDNLRELYIDDCPQIDAKYLITSLDKFECLEVLSVAGIQTVDDEFVISITALCGGNLKELNLASCLGLTDRSLKAIGNHCPELCSLNISNLCNLTDLGLCYLANGCRSLQSFNISCNEFSDEAVAAFLETSGASLNELSLNKVCKVGLNTALSLGKCSRKLTSLDLSWCRGITNEALGLIVDSCSSLRLLKLFGCTQITQSLPARVWIVGSNQTQLLQHIDMFEPVGVLLRYSPLKSPVLTNDCL